MLSWFNAMMPKEERFFDLFNAHAATLAKGADALRKALDGGPEVAAWCAKVVEYEHEADDVAHETLLAVRRSFITPFDRSDIRGLANSLDDAIDQMHKTVKSIQLFEIGTFEPHMRQLADVAVQAASRTVEAVSLLPAMRKNHDRLNTLTAEVAKLESQSDDMYDEGMKALFLTHRGGDALEFVTRAEVYDHLEKVVDRFEDVANRINGILVEHL